MSESPFLIAARVAPLIALTVAALACRGPAEPRLGTGAPAAAPQPPAAQFSDITSDAGLANAQHVASADPTGPGGGAALIDADHDGDLDIVLVGARPPQVPGGRPPSAVRLYVNDGQGRFTDRTAAAALDVRLDGVAVVAGDFDNDGWADLFVTGTDGQVLLENVGGRFHDVTRAAGVAARRGHGSSCALWLDADSDGDLDLVVCETGPGAASLRLYVNRGDGGFVDRSTASGLIPAAPAAAPSAVALVHLDGNACPDVVLASATGRQGFVNSCAGTFTAFDASSLGDHDRPGGPPAGGLDAITDETGRAHLASALFFDYDLDGRLDRLAVGTAPAGAGVTALAWNSGESGAGRFVPVAIAGALAPPVVARGAAYGDVDGDGDLDLLLQALGGPVRLLRNDLASARAFRLRLVGTASPQDAAGAIVEVTAAGRTRRQVVTAGRGYLSQSELTLTFGLAAGDAADVTVRITWPSGAVQSLSGVPLGQTTTITEIS